MQVITFSHKHEPSNLLRGIATRFAAHFGFALVADTLEELRSKFQVTSVPAIVLQQKDGQRHVYTGSLKAVELAEWLQQFAPDSEDRACALGHTSAL